MKYLYCFFLAFLYSFTLASGQIIDQIKDASDQHSSQSSNSSGDTYSDDSYDDDDTYYDTDSYDYSDYGYTPDYFGPTLDVFDWVERKRADSTYKFSALNLSYRRTTSSGQVVLSVPEVQFKLGAYCGSFRINQLIEEGIKKEDRYATTDFQILGFQTNPKSMLALNLSFGLMAEQYSGNVFAEGVAGLRFLPTSSFAIAWEGRLAGDDISVVRSENTFSAQFAFLQTPDLEMTANAFTTASMYYEEVSVNGFGVGLGIRF